MRQGRRRARIGHIGGGAFLPLGEDRFTDPAGCHRVEFAPWPDARMTARLVGAGAQAYHPIEEQSLTPEDFAAYAGVYWSEETEYRYTVVFVGGRLMMKTLKQPPYEPRVMTRDLFTGGSTGSGSSAMPKGE